jgi:hypothetical protein
MKVKATHVSISAKQKAKEMFAHGECVCGKRHVIYPATPFDEAAMDCPRFGLVWEWRLAEMIEAVTYGAIFDANDNAKGA